MLPQACSGKPEKLYTASKSQLPQRKGDVLLHVIRNAGEVAAYPTDGLHHQEVGGVVPQVVEDH